MSLLCDSNSKSVRSGLHQPLQPCKLKMRSKVPSTWLEYSAKEEQLLLCLSAVPVHPVHGISGTVLPFQLQYCSAVQVSSCAGHVKETENWLNDTIIFATPPPHPDGMLVHHCSKVTTQHLVRLPQKLAGWYQFILLCGERHCDGKVSCPKTWHNDPSQASNPDHLIQSPAL